MKLLFKLSIALVLFTLIWSCRGDRQRKLIGNWEQISFYDPETITSKKIWKFTPGVDLIVYTQVGEEYIDSTHYTYQVAGSVFDVFDGEASPVYLPAARDPRGQYWIDQLTSSNCKLTKRKHPDGTSDAVYMRVELVKR